MKEKLLTAAEAADLLGVGRETLRHWRRTGYGPPVATVGERKIRYPEGPLKAWIRCHTLIPESLPDVEEDIEGDSARVA